MSINTKKMQDENSADEIACRKADLRKQMKKILSDIHTGGLHEEKSRAAADRFFSSNLYKDCDSVFAFVSFGTEISTLSLLEKLLADGKKTAVPVCRNGNLVFKRLENARPLDAQLEKGSFDILEPLESLEEAEVLPEKTVLLMPGLAFSENGGRLGRGKAFYDKFLADKLSADGGFTAVCGFCFDEQIIEDVPVCSTDRMVTHIVSDKRFVNCSHVRNNK